MRTAICLVVTMCVCAAKLAAHDFWLTVAPATVSQQYLVISANVGEHFPKGTNFTEPNMIDAWRVLGQRADVPVNREFRREGDSLTTQVSLPAVGGYVGVMSIKAREIEMTGVEFTDYLKEEGLDQIVAARQAAGLGAASAKERYAKYAKVVVRNGDGPSAPVTRPVGLKGEMVASVDPSLLRAGDTFTVQLLVEEKPIAGARIRALSDRAASQPIDLRTDAEGKVTLTLPHAGAWLLKTIHMARPNNTGSPAVDWESYWVTLAFQMKDPASAR